MTTCRPCLRLAFGAVLALSAFAASAAPSALSESEMSGVYGRGLSDPTLVAFGALSATEQSNASASASATDLAAALGSVAASGTLELDRQQRLQATTASMQTAVKLAQTMSTVATVLAPINALAGLAMLGGMPFGGFVAPVLTSLPALEGTTKH